MDSRRLGRGEISGVRLNTGSVPHRPGAIDLTAMASRAMHHLANNPRPGAGYACRFSLRLLKFPPCPGPADPDPIAVGDTDSRLDWAYGYMKEICGDDSADQAARGVHQRVLGYLRGDGLCWTPQDHSARLPGTWASSWTTGKLLIRLSDDFRRTGEPLLRATARSLFLALRRRADWVDGRAYYAGGNACWDEAGWSVSDASPYHPAMPLEAVVKYYECFHDHEALDFAVAFAEGEMAGDQWRHWILRDARKLTPRQTEQIKLTSSIAIWPTAPLSADLGCRADGSFDHHSHMRGHLGWGMAHLAAITREPRLTEWSKRLLDFYLARGTDFGWIPESVTYPRRSETCAVSDVVNMAEHMAQCGYPDYWDTVERFVRNYIRQAQFFVTPEYEALYRKLHPGANGDQGIRMARELEGGFQGAMGLNDRVWRGTEMDMMGCCVPEGMRAVYTAWKNTVTRSAEGVRVNLSFDRDAAEAHVRSFAPSRGRLEVTAKVAHHFYLRPPSWAPKDAVRLYRQNRPVPLEWHAGYVRVEHVRPGEVLMLEYPMVEFTQRMAVPDEAGAPGRPIRVEWAGNTVVGMEPRGTKLPLYPEP